MSDDGPGCGCGCLILVIVLGFFGVIPVVEWWRRIETLWHEDWSGYAYPDRRDLSKSIYVGSFSDRDACLIAVQRKAGPGGAYECGLNCRQESGLNICVETVGD